jgi:putative molybdopterin biosynthesis protein
MHDDSYLTTEEAGEYLRIKARKVYELAAEGAIPCSKVTGKWLFPRAALDRWIALGLSSPEGYSEASPPAIMGGSTDPLLEWAVRQSGSGLASLPEGSEAGLRRLARDEVAIAAIHMHRDSGDDSAANIDAVRAMPGLHDSVVIALCKREQGLVTAPGNPLGINSLADAVARGARAMFRQQGAGAQLLLHRLLAAENIEPEQVTTAGGVAATGQDLALAIRAGAADWGIVTRAVAETHGLGYTPITWEHFDLVVRRRSYFEPGIQALMRFLPSADFRDRTAALGGYDIAGIGDVRHNS